MELILIKQCFKCPFPHLLLILADMIILKKKSNTFIVVVFFIFKFKRIMNKKKVLEVCDKVLFFLGPFTIPRY